MGAQAKPFQLASTNTTTMIEPCTETASRRGFIRDLKVEHHRQKKSEEPDALWPAKNSPTLPGGVAIRIQMTLRVHGMSGVHLGCEQALVLIVSVSSTSPGLTSRCLSHRPAREEKLSAHRRPYNPATETRAASLPWESADPSMNTPDRATDSRACSIHYPTGEKASHQCLLLRIDLLLCVQGARFPGPVKPGEESLPLFVWYICCVISSVK